MKKWILMLPILFLTACSDGDLAKVAKQMVVVSQAIGQVQTDTIAANKLGLIDENLTANILTVCFKVNVAGKQVDSVIRSIQKLDPASRLQLVNVITPISQALDPTQISFIAGIKNADTKQKVEAGFLLARSTISAVQLIIASGGNN
jgi:hypothetical protein